MNQPLGHPRLGADGTKAEQLGSHSSVMGMCRWDTKLWHLLSCGIGKYSLEYWLFSILHTLGGSGCLHPASPGFAPQFSFAFFVALQSTKLVHLPQILTLHLKRFYFERSSCTYKLSHSLPFPQELDLRKVLTEDQCLADDREKVRCSCSRRADFLLLSALFS